MSNLAPVIKDFVNQLVDLKKSEAILKKNRKDVVTDLKEEGFSASIMMKLIKDDPEKVQLQLEAVKLAGAVLGVPVYVEEADLSDVDVSEERKDFALEKFGELKDIDNELQDLGAEIKKVLAEVKSNGLIPKVVLLIAEFQVDDKRKKQFDEQSMVIGEYLAAYANG